MRFREFLPQRQQGPGWNSGLIVARAYPGDFPDKDYQRILRGTRATPDAYTLTGAPMYFLPEWELHAAQDELDKLCVDRHEVHNTACNAGRTIALNLIGNQGGTGVTYFAVGVGSPVSPSNTDTQLVSEFYRTTITSVVISGNQVLLATNFSTGVGNTTYTEAGLFGGATASGTANSGSLFAHALYNYAKDSTITLTNDYYVFLN